MWPDNPRERAKLVRELIILGVVGALALLWTFVLRPRPQAAIEKPVPLDTTFKQDSLSKLQNKDINYPDVTPRAGSLGKSNPFQ